MYTILITVLHVVMCIALILIVLLQTGKGADMGAAFGGGSSQTLFGSSGPTSFLSKGTTVVAVMFMLTSLLLAYTSSRESTRSVMSSVKATAPVEAPMPEDIPMPDTQDQAELPKTGE